MSEHDWDPDRDQPGDDLDPDTSLILDYLSNKLQPDEAGRLEDRARTDKDFRYKLADMVLLKGLVTLALEKNPTPAARTCKRARRTFLDYLRGRTSAPKTAELSRHLDECLECEMAFERLESREAGREHESGWGAFARGARAPRRLVVVGLAAVMLAVGAFGIVAFLSSAGAARHDVRDGPAQAGGLVLRPAQVRGALADLRAADPTLDAGGSLSSIVDQILDPTTEPPERADAYARIGRKFGARAERLLWVLAENEPGEPARTAAYEALAAVGADDSAAMLAAARRETQARSPLTHLLIARLASRLSDGAREFFREFVAHNEDRRDEWFVMNLRLFYAPMKGDPAVDRCMAGCLAHPSDLVRSIAASTAADAGDAGAIPIALDLLGSPDATARFNALVVLKRHATDEQCRQALLRDGIDPETRLAVEDTMQSRGLAVPKKP